MKFRLCQKFTSSIFYWWKYPDLRYISVVFEFPCSMLKSHNSALVLLGGGGELETTLNTYMCTCVYMCVLSCRASWSSSSTRYYSYGWGGGRHTWQEWVRQWLFRQPSWAIFLWIMLSTALPLQLLLRISQLEANLCLPASTVYGLASIYAGQLLCQRSNCCRSRMCIRGHIPMPAIFALFLSIFHTCPIYM